MARFTVWGQQAGVLEDTGIRAAPGSSVAQRGATLSKRDRRDPGELSPTPIQRLHILKNELADVWDGISVHLAEDSEIASNRVTGDRGGIGVLESARVSVVRSTIVGTEVDDSAFGAAIHVFQTGTRHRPRHTASRLQRPARPVPTGGLGLRAPSLR